MHFFTFSLFLTNLKENRYSHKTFMHKLFVEKSKGFPTMGCLFLYLLNCGRKLKFSDIIFWKNIDLDAESLHDLEYDASAK